MTKQHHVPSKLEAFLAVFGAALGFSVLFMFALSSFVNTLYETGGEHTSGTLLAEGENPASGHNSKTTYIVPRDGKPAANTPSGGKTAPDTPSKTAGAATGPDTKTASLAKLLATANPKKGAKVAKKCVACHEFKKNGKNKVGPALYELIGRKIATGKGFKYSPAMKKYASGNGTWNYDNLGEFLQKPRKLIPKTKMVFTGIRKKKDLLNLMAWLRTNADKPMPLPLY